MKPLPILRRAHLWQKQKEILSLWVSNYLRGFPGPASILEAGCGRQWNLDISLPFHLTGVDISEPALKIRRDEIGDLDEIIIGDLHTVDLAPDSYDVIYSSFVLEHLPQAALILDRFRTWLKPGGILVLLIPDRDSVFGFLTRLSPHWIHVLYYKWVMHYAHAGKPGYGPFKTYYDPVIGRKGLHKYSEQMEFPIVLEFGAPPQVTLDPGLRSKMFRGMLKLVEYSSLGRLSADHQNLISVMRKPGGGKEIDPFPLTPYIQT